MTRSQIIKQVNDRTENKLVGQVDFNDLFNDIYQEFCAEHRFWWLHKRLSFSTAANVATYDLNSITTVPASAGPFVDEITRVILIDSNANVCPLVSVFDDEGVAATIAATGTDQPGLYTVELNDDTNEKIIRLSKTPNGVYTIHVYHWAAPNPTPDGNDDTIYLVPPTKHHILKTALEAEVWRLEYGEENPKYTTAIAKYNKKVALAKHKPAFSTQNEQFFNNQQNESIRSTR